ncbi:MULTISPECIES: AraC family transcriptional regulator [Burkholderia]|uniref:Transcriptional regulator PchR n=1 Tax=Burkholderia lata (strain ATCC 17760 / DSM 23089 / LMG 22485 / NCIMB 9086 / R18194 / 383) TaxID=482957 RepID=A0A6P2S533_BURL3|nr:MULTISPECIES: AraC family transcriptional regulator [Burkholderia]MBN3781724.1 helix-turn-helix transcriptional regulator [Burkholderia sp. Ac-20345]MBN3800418.1 helix-turn-helix transcriptional regulator [Burkholderia sp. Ac-20392]VWC20439.1 transcriptional regulator PchR [Burkholderia lata]VWC40808.1 transcriptional regulator PchR [Burkholderia lata]VWD49400.1 transcriptional regulator PchR [Burkholderia lata]
MSSTSFASSRRHPPVLVPGNHPGVVHIDAGMKLMSGTLCSDSRDWYEEPLEKGLKLVLVQSGQLRCRVPGQPEQCIKGPGLCVIANDGEFTTHQIYDRDTPLRYTIVQLGLDALDRNLSLLPEKMLAPTGGDPRIVSCPASKALQALAVQIATCPFEGAVREYYLKAKAFELTALSAQLLATQRQFAPADVRVTSSDVERVYAASDILTRELQQPPTLDALAGRVGMNSRKLTAGFRKVFGTSVYAYLQEYRLRTAHAMLCAEDANVSTVAYRVGYSPAHFSIAFRKRYGISPSDIRASSNAIDDIEMESAAI